MPASKTPRKREVKKLQTSQGAYSRAYYDTAKDIKSSNEISPESARVKIGDKGMSKLISKKGKEEKGRIAPYTATTQSTSQTTASPKRKLSQTEKNTTAKNESQRRISKVEAAREKRQLAAKKKKTKK